MVAGCETSLREKRYKYRHDCVLLHLGRILESIKSIDIFIDIPGYKCPTMITGKNQRPDLIVISNNKLYVLELTAGYETNIKLNSKRKEENYRAFMDGLAQLYNSVMKFGKVNIVIIIIIIVIIIIGCLMLVGGHPMKSLLSVCPSVYPSVLSFLKSGSLGFFFRYCTMIADHDIW